MDFDLGPGWEKKALIIIVVIALIVVVYANNPFKSNPTLNSDNNTTAPPAPVTQPTQNVIPVNNTTNNNNITNNSTTFTITSDQAKQIVTTANPGYTVGTPTKGNITLNNNNFAVWIVPLTQGSKSKNVYVNAGSGVIVGEQVISG